MRLRGVCPYERPSLGKVGLFGVQTSFAVSVNAFKALADGDGVARFLLGIYVEQIALRTSRSPHSTEAMVCYVLSILRCRCLD